MVPAGSSICPLAKKTFFYKTKGKKEKKHTHIFLNTDSLRDGLHGTTCGQLEWADMVLDSFNKDDARIVFVPRYITESTNVPSHPTPLTISNTNNGILHISIKYDFISKSEGNALFNTLMAIIEWENIKHRSVK